MDAEMQQPLSILVVDNDRSERAALTGYLRDLAFAQVQVDDGERALTLLADNWDIGLILVDTEAALPACAEQILASLKADDRLHQVPVVVTAAAYSERLAELLALGADDYLIKPYRQALVEVCLRQVLQMQELEREVSDLLNIVIPIGVELSTEGNFDHLLEKIVIEAKTLCRADAGTLYLRTKYDKLQFVIVRNTTLDIKQGGTTGNPVTFPPLPLYDEETEEVNYNNVATYVALTGETVNVNDAYTAANFDFSGTKKFDQTTGYRSKSFLTLPLTDDNENVIGVLQLINAMNETQTEPISFSHSKQKIVESLAKLATVALKAYIREEQLRQQIENLRIEIDETKREREVAYITETKYFQDLQEQVNQLRKKDRRSK